MKRLVIFVLCFLNVFGSELPKKHAICYIGEGQFSRQLELYAQARYLSSITPVSFLYRPLPSLENFTTLNRNALSYFRESKKYQHICHIYQEDDLIDFFLAISNPSADPTLFILHSFPRCSKEKPSFFLPWDDEAFLEFLQSHLKQKVQIPTLTKSGMLNVAVHVRTLTDNETLEDTFIKHPLKHPNLEYHLKQIKMIFDWNCQKPMHVFLFTDGENPLDLMVYFKDYFDGCPISFDIQTFVLKGQDPTTFTNALLDFFAMQKFDCLIATRSNFSTMAANLGSFDMVVYPEHYSGKFPDLQIDRVQVISKKSDWFPFEMNMVTNL